MTPLQYGVVAATAVLGGALNVAAAGGGVVVFLVLTGLGVPPHIANATHLVAAPASFAPMAPKVWADRAQVRGLGLLSAVAVVCTVAGVALFWITPPTEFARWAPVLLLVATATLVAHPWLKRTMARDRDRDSEWGPVTVAATAATSVYAGYFGAGVSVLVLAALAATTSWPWLRANGVKNVLCLVTALVGAAVYSATGLVDWTLAAVLAGGLLAGGHLGRVLLERLPGQTAETVLRESVAVMSAFAAGVMLT